MMPVLPAQDNLDDINNAVAVPTLQPYCAGCQLQLEQTDSSICVSFGDALWHVECFRCHKCGHQIQPDSTVLLLSSGLPICEDCSYVCSACGVSISNEAIVTGNDSYHAYCFRCKACDTRIDELVFAKTTSGIYCMACHNERVARTRRHAESKRNRSLRRSARDRDNEVGNAAATNGSSNSNGPSSHRQHSNHPHRSGKERSHRVTDATEPQSHAQSKGVTVNPTSVDTVTTSSAATLNGSTPLAIGADQPESSSITTPRKHPAADSQNSHGHNIGVSPNHLPQQPVVLQNAPPPRNLKQMRENSAGTRPGLGIRASNSSGGFSAFTSQYERPTSTSPSAVPAGSQGSTSNTTSPLLSSRFVSTRTSPSPHHRSQSPAIVLEDSDTESVATDTDLTSRHHRDASNTSRETSVKQSPAIANHSTNIGHNEALRSDLDSLSARSGEHRGLSVPQTSSKSAKRRSGFYGVANIPPASPPVEGHHHHPNDKAGSFGSVALKPSSPLSRPIDIEVAESNGNNDGYFAERPSPNRSASAAEVPQANALKNSVLAATSCSLAAIDQTSSTSVSTPQTSPPVTSMISPLRYMHTSPRPRRAPLAGQQAATTPQSTSAQRVQDPTPQPIILPPVVPHLSSPIRGSLSLYDTDILVFLDAVNDPTALKRSSTGLGMSVSAASRASDIDDGALSSDSHIEADEQPSKRSSRRLIPSRQADSASSPSLGRKGDVSGAQTPSMNSPSRVASPISENKSKLRNDKPNDTLTDAALSPKSSLTGTSKRKGRASVEGQLGGQPAFGTESAEVKASENVRKLRESIRRSRGGSISTSIRSSGMTLDVELVESLLLELEQTKNKMKDLQKNYNAIRRASRQAFEGFSMAREEYDREVQSRRDAEFEMMQLREQLKQQAKALGNLDEIHKQQEMLQTKTETLRNSCIGMEKELSKIKAERDIAVAEIEELASVPKLQESTSDVPKRVSVMLNARLSAVRDDYRQDLEQMALERDALKQELEDLRQAKDIFIAETDSLNKRNAELANERDATAKSLDTAKADLAQMRRQLGTNLPEGLLFGLRDKELPPHAVTDRSRAQPWPHYTSAEQRPAASLASSYQASSVNNAAMTHKQSLPTTPHSPAVEIVTTTMRAEKPVITAVPQIVAAKKFKWGSKKGAEKPSISTLHRVIPQQGNIAMSESMSSGRQHSFQATSILRPVRCEHCSDKMWGMGELRCQVCGVYCHTKCLPNYYHLCAPGRNHSTSMLHPAGEPPEVMLAMSMFGNDLVAQCLTEERSVPRVVTKCIAAVEVASMDYEGIYRKSGGMGQTKTITAHFDRGDAFDLMDPDKFNDISAVTSVLKNYFRQLPNPLFTFECHEELCALPAIKDPSHRNNELAHILASLPEQHFDTLKTLMMHLHRIHLLSAENKMTPANLGVVFGPTLLRSPDPSQEFSQLNLKARIVEITVENAPHLFAVAHHLET